MRYLASVFLAGLLIVGCAARLRAGRLIETDVDRSAPFDPRPIADPGLSGQIGVTNAMTDLLGVDPQVLEATGLSPESTMLPFGGTLVSTGTEVQLRAPELPGPLAPLPPDTETSSAPIGSARSGWTVPAVLAVSGAALLVLAVGVSDRKRARSRRRRSRPVY